MNHFGVSKIVEVPDVKIPDIKLTGREKGIRSEE